MSSLSAVVTNLQLFLCVDQLPEFNVEYPHSHTRASLYLLLPGMMFFCTIKHPFKFKNPLKDPLEDPLEDKALPTTTLTYTSPTKILEYCLKVFREEKWKGGGGVREILNFKKYFRKNIFGKEIGFKKLSHIVQDHPNRQETSNHIVLQ